MSEQTVKINVEDFTTHHDECLAVADELFTLIEKTLGFSLSMTNKLTELANRLDKSISELPAKFD